MLDVDERPNGSLLLRVPQHQTPITSEQNGHHIRAFVGLMIPLVFPPNRSTHTKSATSIGREGKEERLYKAQSSICPSQYGSVSPPPSQHHPQHYPIHPTRLPQSSFRAVTRTWARHQRDTKSAERTKKRCTCQRRLRECRPVQSGEYWNATTYEIRRRHGAREVLAAQLLESLVPIESSGCEVLAIGAEGCHRDLLCVAPRFRVLRDDERPGPERRERVRAGVRI